MTVLVCGATGTTGGEVLRQLRAAGESVRAMTRHPDAARQFEAQGIDAVTADLGDPASLPSALDGVDRVYVATNASPDLGDHEGALARAAATAGIRLLVKLSVVGASAVSPIAFGRLHHAAEEAVREAGVPATFVRPNGFMQNTLAWTAQIPEGVVRGPILDARWSIVDVRDIAAVAVAALRDPDAHAGETYTVTGPESSSPREQIAIVSEVIGTPLTAQEVSIEQAQEAMLGGGWPPWNVERMGELFRLYADGLADATSPDVERVTGAVPRTYRQFASDHRDAFLGSS